MRNIEVLRDYFLGKDPQLKETLADNSLRLCGIKGKYYVLRDELLAKLKELKDYVDEQDGLLEGTITGLIQRIEAIENDFVTEEELASALSSYYTKSEVDALIATIPRFKVEVVNSLPTQDISTTTLYLVPSQDPETRNAYDEFIYVNNTWEQVGSTAIDMSNYYTKGEVDSKIFFNILTADVIIPQDSEINPLSGLTTGWYYTGTHKVYFENADPNDPLVFPGGIFFLNMTSGDQYFWLSPVNSLSSGVQLGMWGYFDDIALEWVYGGYDILDSLLGISSTSTDQQLATAKAIYDYIQSLNIATITDITASTFNFAHVDTDRGFYSLPANCTISFGEMNGNPVTYTTVSPVLVQVVKESGGHVKHAMFTDIQSDGAYYIYGTTTYPALTGTVVQKKLSNTIEYITVNGSYVPVSNIGVAQITVPTYSEFTGTDGQTVGSAGLVPGPATADAGKFLKADGNWGTPTDTTYSDFVGTDGQTAGTHGLVPAPATSETDKFLKSDGTWGTPPDTTYTAGTNVQINAGVISATDTTYSAFTGATSSVAGSAGLVPAPTTGDPDKFLKGDGTWGTPAGGGANITYSTTDITAGVTPLPSGDLYLVYE